MNHPSALDFKRMPFDGIAALFYRTPQEHLNEMWKIIKTLPLSPPPRHVRVHVYLGWEPGCDETEFVMRHSALVADFPLERSGRLALAHVKSKWALHGCAPIDPCRRARFDTVHPEYISPLAIRVLTETEGVLKLFEPTPSDGTIVHARPSSSACHRLRQLFAATARGDARSTRGHDWPRDDVVANLPKVMNAIKLKYGIATTNTKRSGGASSANIPLTDEQSDVSYSGIVSIGTPAQDFNVMLDTGETTVLSIPRVSSDSCLGSSDLWVATTACMTCTSNVPLFNPSNSSTYKNVNSTLDIKYGSGVVTGYASEDTVTFGGFTLQNQRLIAVDDTMIAGNFFGDSLSGIMGLGFQSISVLKTPPFWQALYNQNLLSRPVFGFYLERYVNQVEKKDTAPGGTLTLGGANASLYAGNIEFIDMPNGTIPSYWLQQVQTVTVQGKSISIPSGSGLAEIWNDVPGSVPLTSPYQGMYAFPCTTDVNVSISFGGTSWAINAADMNVGTIGFQTGQMCIGGIVGIPGISLPSWIIGDVFLKNVYSVFSADPPAVGFAQLASGLENPGGE
ncbi:aspartic peptidase domain-containing protein [Lanmaoa asiatica]|nr:aspartic peptidase domain-containing protein [Lanmaoa asiatica]